jgi:hypothetical protein
MSLFNRGEGARNRVFLDKVTAPPNVGGAILDDGLAITGQGNGAVEGPLAALLCRPRQLPFSCS